MCRFDGSSGEEIGRIVSFLNQDTGRICKRLEMIVDPEAKIFGPVIMSCELRGKFSKIVYKPLAGMMVRCGAYFDCFGTHLYIWWSRQQIRLYQLVEPFAQAIIVDNGLPFRIKPVGKHRDNKGAFGSSDDHPAGFTISTQALSFFEQKMIQSFDALPHILDVQSIQDLAKLCLCIGTG